MDASSVLESYRRYSRIYVFRLNPGRSEEVKRMELKSDDRVLEIGIGTWLSLPLYPTHVNVTGIDITAEMLEQAQQRVDLLDMDHVQLHLMDAQKLSFP